MLRPLGLVLLLVGLTARLTAQDYRYELGGSVSSSYYLGDIGRRGLIAPQALGIALELRCPVSLRWALMGELALRGLRGKTDYAADAFPSSAEGSREFHRTLLDLALGGEFNFFPTAHASATSAHALGRPSSGQVLGLAGGMSDHRLQLLPGVYARLGLKLRLSPRWGLTASWSLRRTFSDRLEGSSLR